MKYWRCHYTIVIVVDKNIWKERVHVTQALRRGTCTHFGNSMFFFNAVIAEELMLGQTESHMQHMEEINKCCILNLNCIFILLNWHMFTREYWKKNLTWSYHVSKDFILFSCTVQRVSFSISKFDRRRKKYIHARNLF